MSDALSRAIRRVMSLYSKEAWEGLSFRERGRMIWAEIRRADASGEPTNETDEDTPKTENPDDDRSG
jgi:hypothetical protein